MLTQERLKEVLKYNESTGELLRINKNESLAGWVGKNGYKQLSVDNKKYYYHRVIWLLVYGYFPESDIDHIDGNKLNNKLNNLREISRSCNIKNTGNKSNNKSGVKGVHFDKRSGKWYASITNNKVTSYLGEYKIFIEAVCAHLFAEQCLAWENCNSSSPAYKYMRSLYAS